MDLFTYLYLEGSSDLDSISKSTVFWQAITVDTPALEQHGTFHEWKEFCREIDAINTAYAVIPSRFCITGVVSCPAKSFAQAQSIGSYLIEEFTISDAESLHTIVTNLHNGRAEVTAIDYGLITKIKEALSSVEVKKIVLLSASNLFSALNERIRVVLPGDGSTLLIDDASKVTLGTEDLTLFIDHENDRTVDTITPDKYLSFLASEINSRSKNLQTFNLLRGDLEFGKKSLFTNRWVKFFVLVAAVSWSAHLGYAMHHLYNITEQGKASRDVSRQIYKDMFPDEKRIVNPRRQLEAKILNEGGEAKGELIPLLSAFLHTLNEANILERTQAKTIGFNREKGRLEIKLLTPELNDLEEINRLFINYHITATYQSASRSDDGYSATFIIQFK